MDVQPTVKVIKDITTSIIQYAKDIDRIADKMLQENDITYVSEVMSGIRNLISNIRLDLLVSVPFRAYEKEIIRNTTENIK